MSNWEIAEFTITPGQEDEFAQRVQAAEPIFAAQALVILMSPAVALARQPDMVGECA